MITKGDVNKLKTLADAEALLLQYRSEDKIAHDRMADIEIEIKLLREEKHVLRKSVNNGVDENDILLKIGSLYGDTI